jgi:ligand-binding SRPBCC domain-containing protein
MMSTMNSSRTYRHAFLVRAPRAEVAAFHAAAASLGAITPPLMPMQLHHAPERLDAGDEMRFTLWLGPLPVRWLACLEEATPEGFVDRQVEGPFAAWTHRHRFVAVDEATTEVVDEIEARFKRHVVWGVVGLAMWLGLPLLFAYRGWKTRRLLEGIGA